MKEFKIYTPEDIKHNPDDPQQKWFAEMEAKFLNSEALSEIKQSVEGIAEKEQMTKDDYFAERKRIKGYLRFLEFEYNGIDNPMKVIDYAKRVLKDIDEDFKLVEQQQIDYSSLVTDLKEYLSGCTSETMRTIIELKTAGNNKPLWIGKRTEARQFADYFELKVSAFKKCIDMKNGRPLDDNDKTPKSPNELTRILKKYGK